MDSKSQIEEVKKRLDILELVGNYTQLKKAGRNYRALCPFHNEKTPSFMVSPERGIFKCFGCGEGGDGITFYQKIEGVEFREAIEYLARKTGVVLPTFKGTQNQKQKDNFYKMYDLAAKFYSHILTKHKLGQHALKYLDSRGVSAGSIKNFKIGFAPRSQKFLYDFLVKRGILASDILGGGLALPDGKNVKDRFYSRIMFPIFDTQDRIVAFSGRALGDLEPKYLNSPESQIFNKSKTIYGIHLAKTEIKKEKTAILVEGNLDVISSHQIGVKNVVAPLGTAVTADQLETLKRWADELLVAFDGDVAGNSAAKRVLELAENTGLLTKVVQIPLGKDPDETIKKDPSAWKKAVKEAQPTYDFLIGVASDKYDALSSSGKNSIINEVLPSLKQIKNSITLSHYLQKLSGITGIDESLIRQRMKDSVSGFTKNQVTNILEKPLAEKGRELVEKYLLALTIQSGFLIDNLPDSLIENPNLKHLYQKIQDYVRDEGRFKIKSFVKDLPANLTPVFDDLLLYEVDDEVLEVEEILKKEITNCVSRLKELNLRTKLKILSLDIKQAESSGNNEQVTKLSEKFRDLSQILTDFDTKQ